MIITNSFSNTENELAVAVVTSTYFKLNGHMPSVEELSMQLGPGFKKMIMRLVNEPAFIEKCCA